MAKRPDLLKKVLQRKAKATMLKARSRLRMRITKNPVYFRKPNCAVPNGQWCLLCAYSSTPPGTAKKS